MRSSAEKAISRGNAVSSETGGENTRGVPLRYIELQDGKEMSIWRACRFKNLEMISVMLLYHATALQDCKSRNALSIENTRSFCGQLTIPNNVIQRAMIGHETKRGRRDRARALVTSERS